MKTLFDIDVSQISSILETASGVAGAAFIGLSPESVKNGADAVLCDFTYRTPSGSTENIMLFVKRCVWGGVSESVHYRHLTAHGVPTPRLYGSLRGADGTEIIFIEALAKVRFRRNEETDWRALLSLIARFNACPITSDYKRNLRPFEQIGQIDDGFWISGVPAFPSDHETRECLRAIGVGDDELSELVAAARDLFDEVNTQKRGLLHQDLTPDNVGWLADSSQMVVFDLHKNAMGPRFADVAPYLASPDWSRDAAFLDDSANTRCLREELIQLYLYEYARAGRPEIPADIFKAEVSALAWAHRVSVLESLGQSGHMERVDEVLDFLRNRGSRSRALADGATDYAP